MDKVMTPLEFEKKMMEIVVKYGVDHESAHGCADDLMCDLLRSLGYDRGVHIFERMEKWYS